MAWLSCVFLHLFRSRCILATYCRPAYSCWRCNFRMASCNPCSNSSNSWCRTGVFCREKPVFRYLTTPGRNISRQTGGWVLPKCVLLPPCPAPRSNSSVLGIKYRAGAHPHGYGSISNRNLYWYNPRQFCVCFGWTRFRPGSNDWPNTRFWNTLELYSFVTTWRSRCAVFNARFF